MTRRTADALVEMAVSHIRAIAQPDPETGQLIPPDRKTYEATRPAGAPAYSTLRYRGWAWARVMRAAGIEPNHHGGHRKPKPPPEPEPEPEPVAIVTGNVTSDKLINIRISAAQATAISQAADAADISRNRWIGRAIDAKAQRRHRSTPAAEGGRDTQLSVRLPADVFSRAIDRAERAGLSMASFAYIAICEALGTAPSEPERDPLTDPAYAHLPQPQRDPITGQLIPPKDADGPPIWRVRVLMGERTCLNCGETFTPRRDSIWREQGACPICGESKKDEQTGTRHARPKQPSVPTLTYLREGEYQIAARRS